MVGHTHRHFWEYHSLIFGGKFFVGKKKRFWQDKMRQKKHHKGKKATRPESALSHDDRDPCPTRISRRPAGHATHCPERMPRSISEGHSSAAHSAEREPVRGNIEGERWVRGRPPTPGAFTDDVKGRRLHGLSRASTYANSTPRCSVLFQACGLGLLGHSLMVQYWANQRIALGWHCYQAPQFLS